MCAFQPKRTAPPRLAATRAAKPSRHRCRARAVRPGQAHVRPSRGARAGAEAGRRPGHIAAPPVRQGRPQCKDATSIEQGKFCAGGASKQSEANAWCRGKKNTCESEHPPRAATSRRARRRALSIFNAGGPSPRPVPRPTPPPLGIARSGGPLGSRLDEAAAARGARERPIWKPRPHRHRGRGNRRPRRSATKGGRGEGRSARVSVAAVTQSGALLPAVLPLKHSSLQLPGAGEEACSAANSRGSCANRQQSAPNNRPTAQPLTLFPGWGTPAE